MTTLSACASRVSSPTERPVAAISRSTLTGVVFGTVGISLAIFGVNALQGVFLARLLGPVARGEYATAVFFPQLCTYTGLFGITYAIARRARLSSQASASLSRLATRTGLLTGPVAAIVAMGLAALALPTDKRYLFGLCAAATLFLPFEHLRLALLAVDQGKGQFQRYNRLRMIAACAFPLLLAVGWAVTTLTAELAVVLYVAASLAMAMLIARAFRADRLTARPDESPRALLREGLPYAASVAMSDAFSRLDYLLILLLASLEAQGYYAAAVPAASLLTVIPNALAIFVFNAAVDRQSLTRRRWFAFGLGVVIVQLVSALAFASVLEPLVLLVFGTKFTGTVEFARALLPAQAICGVSIVVEAYLRGRGQSRVTVVSRLVGAAALLASAAWLYRTQGDVGIPLAAGVGYAVALAWMLAAAVRVNAKGVGGRRADFGELSRAVGVSPLVAGQGTNGGMEDACQ